MRVSVTIPFPSRIWNGQRDRADSLPADGLRTPPPEEIRTPKPDWSDVLKFVEGEAGCSDADSDGSHSDY